MDFEGAWSIFSPTFFFKFLKIMVSKENSIFCKFIFFFHEQYQMLKALHYENVDENMTGYGNQN